MSVKHKPKTSRRMGLPVAERIKAAICVNESTGCWEWMKFREHNGYGRMRVNNKTQLCHRMSYEAFVGPIPDGLFVCHRCDNPPCCNPEHLFVGTNSDNQRDCVSKGRWTHPVDLRGTRHPLSKLNDDKVREIRRLCKNGISQSEVGRMFGVTQGAVWLIIHRKKWAHVD
jgi:hypothetical protein